ncbi:MAG: hypothetical protein AVDCRST_MAG32-3046, partial [uncultured Nocardioides sp.]
RRRAQQPGHRDAARPAAAVRRCRCRAAPPAAAARRALHRRARLAGRSGPHGM